MIKIILTNTRYIPFRVGFEGGWADLERDVAAENQPIFNVVKPI